MTTRGFWQLKGLEDEALVGSLRELVAKGRSVDARVVAHLAELDSRRLHLRAGKSLYSYCLTELGLSESQAHYRIVAARAARRFPIVFELLESGQVHLTTLALIGKLLTPENHHDVLLEVRGKTKRQVLRVIARRFPRADVESAVRRIGPREVAVGPTGTLEPLSQETSCLRLSVSDRLVEKLELARDLMSHANPSGDLAVVVERALDALLKDLQQRRFGTKTHEHLGRPRQTNPRVEPTPSEPGARLQTTPRSPANQPHPAASPPHQPPVAAPVTPSAPHSAAPPHRQHIGNATRRALLARDGLCCSFVGEKGQRCAERAFLQIHHVHAWAKGGPDSIENLKLVCAAHNQLLAEQEFGWVG